VTVPPDRPDAGPPEAAGRSIGAMTQLWAAFVVVVAAVAILPPVLAPDPGSTVPAVLPALLALAGGAGALVGTIALDRGLAATAPADDDAAVAEFRSRLVLQAALAEAPALLGVVLAFVLGPPWVATVGALPGLVALLRVRPSTARIERFDEAWRAQGADVSLRRALQDV
jgi:F0F1-type ATP synthase membrane subunit c/vacuolar-type H+-ATPase subunit K